MAFLGVRSGVRVRSSRKVQLLAVLGGLSLLGCAILGGNAEREGPGFSHRLHIEEQGLTCAFCHGREVGGKPPAMPDKDVCQTCHKTEPDIRMLAGYFTDWKLQRPPVGSLDEELNFVHAQHSVTLGDCGECHTGIDSSERIEFSDRVEMSECMDCHADRKISNDCGVCHKEIGRDWAPTNHGDAWKKFHGQVARMRSDVIEENCSLCHSESTCVQCHQVEEPEGHNNFFRLRGHGMIASMDRASCAACHRSDFCERCHQETTPLSHRGNWGSPTNQHCLGCHFPLPSEGCITCHKSMPSHQTAAPKPADHFATMNCRQCHGVSVPLPHVDDGSDCNFCHK